MSAETKAAAKHRATALSTTGLAALLWGSMASSAAAIAAILTTADLAGGANHTYAHGQRRYRPGSPPFGRVCDRPLAWRYFRSGSGPP